MWIALTLFAAFNQALRTGLQKQTAKTLPSFLVAWLRFAFGLPFAVVWLVICWTHYQPSLQLSAVFAANAMAAAVTQLLATYFAVQMLTLRNYMVGITWIKSEAIFTAVFAMAFFGLAFSWQVLIAAIIGSVGLMLLNQANQWLNVSTLYGIGAGVNFALCALFISQAAKTTEQPFLLAGAITLVAVLVIQVVIATPLLHKNDLAKIAHNQPAAWAIGLTSALGSIGWFSAMALVSPALVKIVGQSEFVFTVLFTYFWFKERPTQRE